MAGSGGRRPGAGRKPGVPQKRKSDIADVINSVIPPNERIGLLAERARGVLVQEIDKRGESRVYSLPPSENALKILEEYASGKPIQRTELTGKDGEDLIKEIRVKIVRKS